MPVKLILATNNPHKVKEIQKKLGLEYSILPQNELKIPEVEETGSTFIENALLKAKNAAQYTQFPVLADDSGLVVDALNGAPGIYSARYGGIKKLLAELKNVPQKKRQAHFHCTMVLLRNSNDPDPIIAQGRWYGEILFKEQGANGFGYDPIFFVPTHNCSAAELSMDIKNKLSHRGQALTKLLGQLTPPNLPLSGET